MKRPRAKRVRTAIERALLARDRLELAAADRLLTALEGKGGRTKRRAGARRSRRAR
jgi:hypothetical protein